MRLALLPFFFSIVCSLLVAQKQSINFDNLFPETCLQQIFEGCAQVQHEFNEFLSKKEFNNYDVLFFTDVIVGKLFHVFSYSKMLVDDKMLVCPEDVQYLLQVIKDLKVSYEKMSDRDLPPQAGHIFSLLLSIEQEINKLFQSNYSVVCAGCQNACCTNLFYPIKEASVVQLGIRYV